MITKNTKIRWLFLIFLLNFSVVSAQVFSIPNFETTNLFYGSNTKPYLNASSSSSLKFRLEPLYLFYIDMDIDANINRLIDFFLPTEAPKFQGNFRFLGASINFPKIKNLPISLGIFTGIYDTLGTDSILQEHFKTKMPDPSFRQNYPASAFRPRNFIQGTGFGVYGPFSSNFYMGFYTSWNEKLNDNLAINSDFRMGGSFSFFSFDFFAGAVLNSNFKKTKLRTGIAMLFDSDGDYNFFAEAGVAEIKIEKANSEHFNSNFYSSFEAKIRKDFVSSAISFFVSPVFLLPEIINDTTLKNSFFTGLSADIKFGNIEINNMEGGISVMGSLNPLKPMLITPFSLLISPFYTLKVENFELDFRTPISPLLYKNTTKAVTVQISIKAVY